MKFCLAIGLSIVLGSASLAQLKPASQSEKKVVTVPATIDHNRIVIEVEIAATDGSTQQVRAWINPSTSELLISPSLNNLLRLGGLCGEPVCESTAPLEIVIGGMDIPLHGVKTAKVLLRSQLKQLQEMHLGPGLDADIAIPSTVLRNYDVLIDYPGRKFTIGQPGTIHFLGSSGKIQVNENAFIEVPVRIENKKYDLALDLSGDFNFLASELFHTLETAHPDWPHMVGAVGPANSRELMDDVRSKLMRVDRLQFGPLFLTNVPIADKGQIYSFRNADKGSVGAESLLNYRVGIDYAHSTVYFDIGRLANLPDFDVVGLILQAEEDGRYTILGIADIDGKPSVPSGENGLQPGDSLIAINDNPVHGTTLGAVWSLLGGTPGQEHVLTIERAGKQFNVTAQVQHFLAEAPDTDERKGKRKH